MHEFIIEITCANDIDTYNRICNKLAGRDFMVKELIFSQQNEQVTRCALRISAIRKELDLCLTKLLNYQDVFSYKSFMSIENEERNEKYGKRALHA